MAPRLSSVSVETFVLGIAMEMVGDLSSCTSTFDSTVQAAVSFPIVTCKSFWDRRQMIIKEASKNNCMLNRCSAAPVLSVPWQRLCPSGQNCRCANKRRIEEAQSQAAARWRAR